MSCEATTADDVMSEMREAVKEAMPPGERIQRGLETAARRLGITYSRAWALWYGKARRVDAHEADNVRRRLVQQRVREVARLRARIEELEHQIARDQEGVGQLATPTTANSRRVA